MTAAEAACLATVPPMPKSHGGHDQASMLARRRNSASLVPLAPHVRVWPGMMRKVDFFSGRDRQLVTVHGMMAPAAALKHHSVLVKASLEEWLLDHSGQVQV